MTRLLCIALLAAQTVITPPDNKYSPAEDVKLGQEAAAQAEQQLPIMRDDAVTSYVEGIGRRLVAAIPENRRQPEFRYSFKVVNVREINAFALPGGPMYVNRGMIEAARTEGEVAGVMAHELSHVVLRHGTAQASKATKFQFGAIAGAIAGAIIGGNLGTVISEGTRFGLGTAFLRYGREYEKQADLEGAQMMARAGYDPRDMASMFQTIEKQGGSGGPQWLSDHPNPGNRAKYITEEAAKLRVENPIRDTSAFEQVKAHLQRLPKAPTTEEATKTRETAAPRAPESRPPGTSSRRRHATRPTRKATCSRSACRPTGASCPGPMRSPSRRRAPTERSTGRASSPTASRSGCRGTRRTICKPRPTSWCDRCRTATRICGTTPDTIACRWATGTACTP